MEAEKKTISQNKPSLIRQALSTAWPSTLESFFTAFVSLVDTAMVSALGKEAIAAVGLTNQPRMMALVPFVALQMAVSALVARRRGQGDRDAGNLILKQALVIALAFAAVISIGGIALAGPILTLSGSRPDTHMAAAVYFRIVIGGIGLNAVSLVINAAQRGCGNTRIAFYTNLASNAVNIVLNYLLIEGHYGFPALGVAGAAIATVIGTAVAAIMSIVSVCFPSGFLFLLYGWKQCRVLGEDSRSLLHLSKDIFKENIFKRLGLWAYAMLVARLGTEAFATHQMCMNLLTVSFSIGDGLSIATVSLVGQSLGAGKPEQAQTYLNILQKIGVCFSAIFSIAFWGWGRQILLLFSPEPKMLTDGTLMLKVLAVIVVVQITHVIYIGCLRGAGDTRYITVLTLVTIAIIRPLLGLLFCYVFHWGLLGAWLGILCEQICRLLLSWYRVRQGKWVELTI